MLDGLAQLVGGNYMGPADANLEFESYLTPITFPDLYKKIGAFKRLDFRRMAPREIMDRIYDVLRNPYGRILVPATTSTVTAGTTLYRARSLPQDDKAQPPSAVSLWSHIWEPPADKAFAGRLNEDNEALLYTAFEEQIVAIRETGIAPGDRFALIRYSVTADFKASVLLWEADSGLTLENRQKMEIILSFLNEIMTSAMKGRGTYRATAALTKDLGDYPECEAWQYNSVASPGGLNICLKPQSAHQKLLPTGVAILEWHPNGEHILLKTDHLLATDTRAQTLSPHDVASPEGQHILSGFVKTPALAVTTPAI